MNMLPDITIPRDNPITKAALKLATVFWYSGSLQERELRFGVAIVGTPDLDSKAEVIVTVAIQRTASNRRGIIWAGMVGE